MQAAKAGSPSSIIEEVVELLSSIMQDGLPIFAVRILFSCYDCWVLKASSVHKHQI